MSPTVHSTIHSTIHSAVRESFQRSFSAEPTHIIHAPGRVNLIGEHTDYNDGWVLPCALDYGVVVAISPREDDLVNVVALDYDEARASFSLPGASGATLERGADLSWLDYVKGVFDVLSRSGHTLGGADLVIGGDVPQGAGLSSSAALQVALGWSLSTLYQLGLSRAEIARYAQRAENEFVGCQCGIMDQLASALGAPGHAILIDCRSIDTTPIPISQDLELIIANSNVHRELAESAYNERRAQCEEAARILGVSALRDATLDDLEGARAGLSDVVYRRARHVITENARVISATEALKRGDVQTLGELMRASHRSLRDDFEVTVPPVNTLVSLLDDIIGDHGGARMTGGGFGGCVVAVSSRPLTPRERDELTTRYHKETGIELALYRGEICSGVRVVSPMS